VSFDVYASHGQEPNTSYDSPASTGVAYLFDVAARPAREHKDIQPGE
jgi:hypothetical protein